MRGTAARYLYSGILRFVVGSAWMIGGMDFAVGVV